MSQSRAFFIADTHFGHDLILSYGRGRFFRSLEEHDLELRLRWNDVVRPKDIVYHGGDVALCTQEYAHRILPLLKGTKVLIAGNHDPMWVHQYFTKVFGARERKRTIMTHIPVHPMQKERFKLNIHGHLHEKLVMKRQPHMLVEDRWYFNGSADQIDFTPKLISEIMEERL